MAYRLNLDLPPKGAEPDSEDLHEERFKLHALLAFAALPRDLPSEALNVVGAAQGEGKSHQTEEDLTRSGKDLMTAQSIHQAREVRRPLTRKEFRRGMAMLGLRCTWAQMDMLWAAFQSSGVVAPVQWLAVLRSVPFEDNSREDRDKEEYQEEAPVEASNSKRGIKENADYVREGAGRDSYADHGKARSGKSATFGTRDGQSKSSKECMSKMTLVSRHAAVESRARANLLERHVRELNKCLSSRRRQLVQLSATVRDVLYILDGAPTHVQGNLALDSASTTTVVKALGSELATARHLAAGAISEVVRDAAQRGDRLSVDRRVDTILRGLAGVMGDDVAERTRGGETGVAELGTLVVRLRREREHLDDQISALSRCMLADQRPLQDLGDLKRVLFEAAAGAGSAALFRNQGHQNEVRALVEVTLGEDGQGGVF